MIGRITPSRLTAAADLANVAGPSRELAVTCSHRIIRFCERQGVRALADLAYTGTCPRDATG
jgi:hypothetical protein